MKFTDVLCALIVIIVWGGNFVAMRFGAQELPPYFLLGMRLAIASAVLLWFARSPRGMIFPLILISSTLCTLHFGLAMIGVQHIEAGAAAIAMQITVPFAALLAWLIYREKFGWYRTAGMVLSFTGIAIISGMPRIAMHLEMFVVMLVSALFFAVATIQIRRLGKVDFMSINAWVSIFGLPQAFLISWLCESGQIEALEQADLRVYTAFIYMGLVASVVGQGLWYRLVQRYPTNQIMPFTILVPVVGVALGVLFLNEVLSWLLIFGGVLTVLGVTIIILHRSQFGTAEALGNRRS